jgi:signal transduction histidine kinase/CheY-like chemotaxis protein/HPt (histidine-containing phosphotransfer) domain-containing protein
MTVVPLLPLLLLAACEAKAPAFYVSLRDFPAYVANGFESEPAAGWKRVDGRQPVRIRDLGLFDGPRRPFLSPFGEEDRQFTILLTFSLNESTYDTIQENPAATPGIFFTALGDNWEVYLNGKLVRSETRLDEGGRIISHRCWRKVFFAVDNAFFRPGLNTVRVYVTGAPSYANTGMFYAGPYYVAPIAYIARENSDFLIIALCGVYLFAAVYYLMLFLNHRGETYNLYYGLFSLCLGLYGMAGSPAARLLIPNSGILLRLEYGAVFLILPALMAFVESLSLKRVRPLTRAYSLLCLGFTLTTLVFSVQYAEDIRVIWKVSALLASCYLFVYDGIFCFLSSGFQRWKNLRERGSLARYRIAGLLRSPMGNILIFMGILFVTLVMDLWDSLFVHRGSALSQYGFFIFILGSSFTLGGKFNDLYRQLNLLNASLGEANLNLEETVRRRTRELEEQTRMAESASRAKSEFLAQMSHEIRTPLNTILGLMELILRKNITRDVYEDALGVKQAGNNLLAIINDILDFSKIESGMLEINPGAYNLSSLINDCVSMIRLRFVKKPVLFVVNLDSALPNKLVGDEVRVRQIALNLLSNAAKYTREGQVVFTVRGERRGNELNLRFEVRDTGIGIKAEDAKELFNRFKRFDLRRNRDIEGTGLGLAISRNLCRLMGGDITVKSRYGEGSVFTALLPQRVSGVQPVARVWGPETKPALLLEARKPIADSIRQSLEDLGVPVTVTGEEEAFFRELETGNHAFAFTPSCFAPRTAALIREKSLPVQPVAMVLMEEFPPALDMVQMSMPVYAIPLANVLNGKPQRDRQERPNAAFTAPGVKVLIVDDIVTNLNVARRLLSLYGLDIDTCTSGEEAVERIKTRPYDLVLMDQMMPGMDGVEAAAAIRGMGGEDRRFSELPLIALTANAVSGVKEMFLKQGFNDYLAKPIEIARLDEVLAAWIPRERRIEAGTEAAAVNEEGLVIPGVDVQRGLANVGGALEGYREILGAFLEDADDKLRELKELPGQGDLRVFTIRVHGVKSAAAAIGAEELSRKARALETAGKAGDLETIREGFPAFYRDLGETARAIRAALETPPPGTPRPA